MLGPAFRVALALALISSLALAGCGRRGKLEPPPEQNVPEKGEGTGKKKDPGFVKEHKALPMDFLLN
ncbi:LPS translocon maturation chaperone LptM [Labrys monachus]|uniref:Small lipoprotein YifL n=1 Tax=Labrys monachus TaxID=217067 RepID=A0ABU0FNI7_9HYPH|nr:lipoprotein [Labrys monachus]MDQ0396174.1 putative small lipoprotein YifL [Labrys monachus]